jgi:dTDP-4-amino-4,6-dideoxygalactose transaminase
VHYPTALPLLPAYSRLGIGPSSVPTAARNQDRILSLPMYPELGDEMIEYVAARIEEFFSTRSSL